MVLATELIAYDPCHCFQWGYLKDNVYINNSHTAEIFKAVITVAVKIITKGARRSNKKYQKMALRK
jgi:hypothetical protein